MSGHSKWATIKRQKATTDQKRGQSFTKVGRLITLASRDGADPAMNFKLRLALDKAKQVNMPQSTVEKAIKRGAGLDSEGQIEAIIYEAIGPDGLALIIKVATDNKNRTLSEIKNLLAKNNIKFAESGSLSWQFNQMGIIKLSTSKISDEEELALIEAGAEDIQTNNNAIYLYTQIPDLQKVQEKAEQFNLKVENAEIGFVPKNPVNLDLAKIKKLLAAIESQDDIQNIYTNLKIS